MPEVIPADLDVASSTRRRRDYDATRSALLDAAESVFAERGCEAASLDEIARRAGCSRGAFHHHFGSKDDLFVEVVKRRDERLLAGYRELLAGDGPPDPAWSLQRWRDLHGDDEVEIALRLELRARALRDPALRLQLLAAEREAVEATAARLRRSHLREDVDMDVVAMLLHAVSRAALEGSALGAAHGEHLMGFVLEMMFGPGGHLVRGGEDRAG